MIFQCETFWLEKTKQNQNTSGSERSLGEIKNQAEQPVLDIKFDDFCFFFAKKTKLSQTIIIYETNHTIEDRQKNNNKIEQRKISQNN